MKITHKQSAALIEAARLVATMADKAAPITITCPRADNEAIKLTLFPNGEIHLFVSTYGTKVFRQYIDYEMYFMGAR